jgi:hypothetical protein
MSLCTEDFPEGWRFQESANTGVYTTTAIVEGKEAIMRVFHDPEGDWQFHGAGESSAESCALACFDCIVTRDPTLVELADLPASWAAWRESISEPWHREPHQRRGEE